MKNKLSYFVTRASMFGIGFFLLFKNTGKDAWISLILGTILGVIIIYIYHLIKKYFQNKDLREELNRTFLGKIYLLIFIIFNLYLMFIILILLPMFVNSFYLLYTPKILIVIPFLLLAIYISCKEKNTIDYLSNFLFIFSIIIIILYVLLLSKYIDVFNILPIYTNKTFTIIKSALIYSSITSIPQMITINYPANNFKDDLKNYLLGSLTLFGITFFTILSLGEPLIKIYSFPEYAVLKQIKILDFIENIENISSFIWYFDTFIMLSTITINLRETLPKKYNKIYFYITIFITLILATFIAGENYRIISILFQYYPLVLYIFFLVFASILLYLKKRYKKNT